MSEPLLAFDLQLQRRGFHLRAAAELHPGITALFGQSGCGKTTLLRCLAGLEPGVTGHIRHGDTTWLSATVRWPAHRRRAGYVFQDTRLFSHLSVRQNLDYAVRRRRGDGPEPDEVIAVLGLEALLARQPASLSGGEAQRVALGRALLAGPRVLLLDEPLAALDYGRRRRIMPLIRAIPARFNVPLLYVTHARYEVLDLADRVLLMQAGETVSHDRVADIFSNPAHWSALGDIDPMVVWEGRVVARDNDWGLTTLATAAGRLRVEGLALARGERVRLRVAARDVLLVDEPPVASAALNTLPVTVERTVCAGRGQVHVALRAGAGAMLWAVLHRQSAAALRLEGGRHLHALIRPQILGVND